MQTLIFQTESIISSKKFGHKNNKKEQLTFFRQFLHAKAYFSDRKYVSMLPKNSNLHAKIAQNEQVALFNYFCLSELFENLYLMV